MEIVEETFVTNWFAWVHLEGLITFRNSGKTMDAGNCWLDKEISDLKSDLGIEEGDSNVIPQSSWYTATNQVITADTSCSS